MRGAKSNLTAALCRAEDSNRCNAGSPENRKSANPKPIRFVCELNDKEAAITEYVKLSKWLEVWCRPYKRKRRGWHDLEGLVCKFQNRVSFGVRAEIVELTTIPYIKGSRARALYKAGLRTPLAIAEASIPEIVKALFESSSWNEQGDAYKILILVHGFSVSYDKFLFLAFLCFGDILKPRKGLAQRRIQVGVAKKIKNGVHKIVLAS
ncbi:unnamed protein product [Malus baccata var. baccata]